MQEHNLYLHFMQPRFQVWTTHLVPETGTWIKGWLAVTHLIQKCLRDGIRRIRDDSFSSLVLGEFVHHLWHFVLNLRVLLAIVVVKNVLDRDFMTIIQTFVTLDGSSIMHYTWGYTRRILRTSCWCGMQQLTYLWVFLIESMLHLCSMTCTGCPLNPDAFKVSILTDKALNCLGHAYLRDWLVSWVTPW